MCRFPACRVNDSSFIWWGLFRRGRKAVVCGNERRKKDRMDRVRETESPNFERTETKKNENKSGTKGQSKAN